MSRLTAWTAALLILIGSVWSQEQLPDMGIEERSPRFGYGLLESLRKSFCQNYCSSSDTMPYLTNLVCAIKCPELYLPHASTTTSTSSSTTTPSSATEQTETSNQGSQTTAKPSAQTTGASSSATTKPSGTTNSAGTASNTMMTSTPKA